MHYGAGRLGLAAGCCGAAIGAAALCYYYYYRRRPARQQRPAFIFVDSKVHDPKRYARKYAQPVIPTVRRYGGRFLCCPAKATVARGFLGAGRYNYHHESTTMVIDRP